MRLLIIGKLGGQLVVASQMATARGARVYHCVDIQSAMHALRSGRGADLIMIEATQDIRSLISQLKEEHIHLNVVACGIAQDETVAVNAITAGAKEYIPLPPEEEIIAAMLSSIAAGDQQEIIIASEVMNNLLEMVARIARSEASVLITGESGVGKEVIAKYIHTHSKRSQMPLISLNCAAIPDNLLESELFGHEKGAFTGAVARRIGKFEEANNGTIFLDEISEMDMRLQTKLLRVLQEKEIVRVGSNQPIKLNIRVLATSNRNLEQEVRKGTFREDLFYRLNVINVHIPALRQRSDDITPLAQFFIKKYCLLNGFEEKSITANALHKLIEYTWPGNVRELENTLHRSVVLLGEQSNTIDTHNIILTTERSANEYTLIGRTIDSVEREMIAKTVAHCNDNYIAAARILGISIKNLRHKLQKYAD